MTPAEKRLHEQRRQRMVFGALLVVGMLVTGTANTLLNKWQDRECVGHCDSQSPADRHYFEQPVWQTFNMFLGEFLCMIAYAVSVAWQKGRGGQSSSGDDDQDADEQAEDDVDTQADNEPLLGARNKSSSVVSIPSIASDSVSVVDLTQVTPAARKRPLKGHRILLMWIPAICDIIATTLMNVGLLAISASVYQMLRGAVVLFTAVLSYFVLKVRLQGERMAALALVTAGVAIVGVGPILFSDRKKEPAAAASSFSPAIGVLLVLVAQCLSALQFVVEEKIVTNYTATPMKLVGLEGFWGLFTIIVVAPILHFTIGQGTGNFFDLEAMFEQVVQHPVIWATSIGSAISIGCFNYFGLNVTKFISATSRTTIDTSRTLFIWIISLALGWEQFLFVQVVGFLVLIYGTFVFNQVIPLNAPGALWKRLNGGQ